MPRAAQCHCVWSWWVRHEGRLAVGPQDRTDRELVTPWFKFLWETYRTVLDILRNNRWDHRSRPTCAPGSLDLGTSSLSGCQGLRLCSVCWPHGVKLVLQAPKRTLFDCCFGLDPCFSRLGGTCRRIWLMGANAKPDPAPTEVAGVPQWRQGHTLACLPGLSGRDRIVVVGAPCSRLESLYAMTAGKAFQFCLTYKRTTEFRRLCDTLRNHLANLNKYREQRDRPDLTLPETQQLYLETRFEQLKVSTAAGGAAAHTGLCGPECLHAMSFPFPFFQLTIKNPLPRPPPPTPSPPPPARPPARLPAPSNNRKTLTSYYLKVLVQIAAQLQISLNNLLTQKNGGN